MTQSVDITGVGSRQWAGNFDKSRGIETQKLIKVRACLRSLIDRCFGLENQRLRRIVNAFYHLVDCKPLTEAEVKTLCDQARAILVEGMEEKKHKISDSDLELRARILLHVFRGK
ncbi:protein-serine,threonine phosphatase [Sarracenia purpurea var. burkii]